MDEVIGSYRVVRVLGEGGMGRVYLGQHTMIGKQVAIKVLLPQYSSQPDVVNRFFNEARSSSLLKHPGVVDVYDFGTLPSGSAFLVMEYLEGETLSARIRKVGRLSAAALIDVARQAANALAAAHARGIVHRDLKPENIFLVPDAETRSGERTKILDFGIAKLSDTNGVPNAQSTRTGALIGTPTYMSPEQCRGAGHVDHRSDIYSLGCVMFEMATGHPPFDGAGPGEVIGAHLFHTPPSLHGQVSDGLADLVSRMLVKTPADRLQSMSELGASLERLVGTDPRGSSSPASALPTQVMSAIVLPPSMIDAAPRPSPTTLGGASGEVKRTTANTGTRSNSNRVAIIAAVGTAVLLAGGLVWRAVAAHPKAPVAVTKPAVPVFSATPPVKLAAAKPPKGVVVPAAPKKVSLRIVTQPSGADISVDGIKLGTTPWSGEYTKADSDVRFRLHAKGYRDTEISVAREKDVEQSVTLEKVARKVAAPVKNGVFDPFAR